MQNGGIFVATFQNIKKWQNFALNRCDIAWNLY
jgi:hypothetical protein